MDKDLLIQEVAKRHHVLLSPDDPILITVTLNELIIKHHIDQVETKFSETENAIYEMQQQLAQNSKAVAEKIVTDGAKYLHDNFEKSAKELIKKVDDVKITATGNNENHAEKFNELKSKFMYLTYLLLASLIINIVICVQLTLK